MHKSWFEKWGILEDSPLMEFESRIAKLEDKVEELDEKYKCALLDIKRLEEENIETSNSLYQAMNSAEAIEARIDILFEETTK